MFSGQLDGVVHRFIQRVGHSYGRRMMHGVLTSQGIQVSQRRVGESLNVALVQFALRCCVATSLLNPLLYRAMYFGEKFHLNQNERC